MATWLHIPMDKGAVFTRPDHDLEDGELQSCKHFRYEVGSPRLLRSDVGNVVHSQTRLLDAVSGLTSQLSLTDIEYLSFEDSDDVLLAWGLDDIEWTFATAPAAVTSPTSYWSRQRTVDPIGGISNKLGVAHRGNQYFIGVGAKESFVVSAADSWKRMGMKDQEDAGVYSDYDELVLDPIYTSAGYTQTLYGPQKMLPIQDSGAVITNVKPWTTTTEEEVPYLGWIQGNDSFVYFVTEYDKELDVESVPYYATLVRYIVSTTQTADAGTFYGRHLIDSQDFSGVVFDPPYRPEFDFTNYVKLNDRTTHVRLYRMYITDNLFAGGNRAASARAAQAYYSIIANGYKLVRNATSSTVVDFKGEELVAGGLLAEVELGGNNTTFLDRMDTNADPQGIVWTYHDGFYRQMPPRPFNRAATMGDQLVLNINDGTALNVLQFSLSGYSEYFPRNNVLPITTDGVDEILGLQNIGDAVMVLTRSGVHRLNYLPNLTDVGQDFIETVSKDGVVGPDACTVVSMPQGVVLVWLSANRLYLTTGKGSVPACADFELEAIGVNRGGLPAAQLYNNTKLERLELHLLANDEPTTFHFYYGRDQLKAGGFKVTGPHRGIRIASDRDSGVFDNSTAHTSQPAGSHQALHWVASESAVYTLNQGVTPESPDVTFPRIAPESQPLARLTPMQASLQHTAVTEPSDKLQLVLRSKSIDNPENEPKTVTFVGQEYDENDTAAIQGVSGNYLVPRLLVLGGTDITLGKFKLEIEGMPDGR